MIKYINNMARDKKIKLNPSDYIKLFNIKECVLQMHHLEIGLRRQSHKFGYPDIELIYIAGQHYIKKDDLANYRFNNGQIRQAIKKLRVALKKYQQYFLVLKKKNFSKLSLNQLTKNFQQYIQTLNTEPFVHNPYMHGQPFAGGDVQYHQMQHRSLLAQAFFLQLRHKGTEFNSLCLLF